jgi:hypothetical protein
MGSDPPELGKGIFGYRKSAVNQIIADRDMMLRQAEGRVRAAEGRVADLETELSAVREHNSQMDDQIERLRVELDLVLKRSEMAMGSPGEEGAPPEGGADDDEEGFSGGHGTFPAGDRFSPADFGYRPAGGEARPAEAEQPSPETSGWINTPEAAGSGSEAGSHPDAGQPTSSEPELPAWARPDATAESVMERGPSEPPAAEWSPHEPVPAPEPQPRGLEMSEPAAWWETQPEQYGQPAAEATPPAHERPAAEEPLAWYAPTPPVQAASPLPPPPSPEPSTPSPVAPLPVPAQPEPPSPARHDDVTSRFLTEELAGILAAAEESASRIVERARASTERQIMESNRLWREVQAEVARFASWRDQIEPVIRQVQSKVEGARGLVEDVPERIRDALRPMADAIASIDADMAEFSSALTPPLLLTPGSFEADQEASAIPPAGKMPDAISDDEFDPGGERYPEGDSPGPFGAEVR